MRCLSMRADNDLKRLPRVPFRARVQLRTTKGDPLGGAKMTRDLSMGGLFVRDAEPLPVGARVMVEVLWRDGARPLGQCQVVWRRRGVPGETSGFGLQFVELERSAKPFVESVVRHGGLQTSDTRPIAQPS